MMQWYGCGKAKQETPGCEGESGQAETGEMLKRAGERRAHL